MSRASNLILFGVLLMVTPFTGLPISFRSLLTFAFGAVVLSIGISMRAESARGAALRMSAPPEPAAEPEAPVTPSEPPANPSAI